MCLWWKRKVGLKSYSSRMPFKILIAISLYIWKIIACILWMHPASCCRHRENSREINSKYNLLLYVFPNKYLSIRPHLSLQNVFPQKYIPLQWPVDCRRRRHMFLCGRRRRAAGGNGLVWVVAISSEYIYIIYIYIYFHLQTNVK